MTDQELLEAIVQDAKEIVRFSRLLKIAQFPIEETAFYTLAANVLDWIERHPEQRYQERIEELELRTRLQSNRIELLERELAAERGRLEAILEFDDPGRE